MSVSIKSDQARDGGGDPNVGSRREPAHGASRPPRGRILFVSKTAESTGPTTSLGLLLDRTGGDHDVGVLMEGDGPFRDTLRSKGIPHWSMPSLQRSKIPSIVRFLRAEKFSLLYANDSSRVSRNVCLAALLTGTPFVCHVRSMGWRHGWMRLGHLSAARAVIAVSQACAESVARFVRPGGLHVVHNGVPISALSQATTEERSRVRAELGIEPETRFILHVGHVSPRKGHDYALEAMARVVATFPDVRLGFAGAHDRDPEYVHQIRRMAEDLGIPDKVMLLGFRTDVDRLLAGTDLFLHTALADPHPRAVLEAMAAAVPVVAFSTDGVRETVEDSVTGYLVSTGDSRGAAERMLRLLGDPEGAKAMGRAGRERIADQFLETRTSDGVQRVLGTLLP